MIALPLCEVVMRRHPDSTFDAGRSIGLHHRGHCTLRVSVPTEIFIHHHRRHHMSANAVAVASLGNPMTVASVGNIAFSLRDAATGTHLQDVGVPTAGDATSATFTFGGVAAGTYVIAAARQLADGSLAAPEVVSAPFTVVAPTATIPTSITVTLS